MYREEIHYLDIVLYRREIFLRHYRDGEMSERYLHHFEGRRKCAERDNAIRELKALRASDISCTCGIVERPRVLWAALPLSAATRAPQYPARHKIRTHVKDVRNQEIYGTRKALERRGELSMLPRATGRKQAGGVSSQKRGTRRLSFSNREGYLRCPGAITSYYKHCRESGQTTETPREKDVSGIFVPRR
ncbi:hypothetical protein PUN28_007501 [Cardiocondyla obscurior]|uniref:Uncharacterized protein n=1 Tax=Cardiocondyla obscurior TaxID=286306 RepID=A0AAW2G6L1_9HYME